MILEDIVKFDPTFGWKEIIALCAAAFALGGVAVAFLSYLLARRSAHPRIDLQVIYAAFDSRGMKPEGKGRFIYYWTIDMTNRGGRPATLRGFRHSKFPRFVVFMRDGKLLDQPVNSSIYVFDKPHFDALTNEPTLLEKIRPRTTEELGTLNISIPAGETKSLSFALAVDNPDIPIDGYLLCLKLLFNNDYEHDLSTGVSISKPMQRA